MIQDAYRIEFVEEHLQYLSEAIAKTMVGISVTVDVLPEGSLPRSEGKAQRVFDIRKSA